MKSKLLMLKKILATLSASSLLLTSCNNKDMEQEQTIEDETNYESEITTEVLKNTEEFSEIEKITEEVKEPVIKDIIISAVGDCTLGTDTNFGYARSFTNVLDEQNRDFSYFFSGVYDILSQDDLTIANLETTFTDETTKVPKKFNFKGDFDYVNILKTGSVEAVNIANNHIYDYGQKGYNDTITTLENANIPYFGYDNYSIYEVDNIKIGLAGLPGWSEEEAKQNTSKAIEYFQKQNTDLIIMTYHWGIEREYQENQTQENIAHFAIDNGADLVIGHHPHVLQGIEYYNDKYIVYSLGNFVFGGNRNPSDKDTMIFRETFHFEDGILINETIDIIPCSLSSRNDLNDYKPIPLEGEEYTRVLNKIKKSSKNIY